MREKVNSNLLDYINMDINLYNPEKFKKQFLDINFDSILIDKNNDVVNSYDTYIQFKLEYLEKTQNNLEQFTKLAEQFNKLSNNFNIQNNKYSYTFVNNNIYKSLDLELKTLLKDQRTLFSNFLQYVEFLNSK